jgi:hypothetical protein
VLIAVGWISALLPPTMFLPPPMLRPASEFPLTLARLAMVFLAAGTTAVPIDLLNGGRLREGR